MATCEVFVAGVGPFASNVSLGVTVYETLEMANCGLDDRCINSRFFDSDSSHTHT